MFRGRLFFTRRRQEIDAIVEADEDVVVAHAQPVAIVQLDTTRVRGRLVRVIDEDAVRAGVDQPVLAAVELHFEMMAGNHATRVGQDPVVAGRTSNGATVHAEHA